MEGPPVCKSRAPSEDLCDACRGHMLRIPRGLYRGRHRGIWPARTEWYQHQMPFEGLVLCDHKPTTIAAAGYKL